MKQSSIILSQCHFFFKVSILFLKKYYYFYDIFLLVCELYICKEHGLEFIKNCEGHSKEKMDSLLFFEEES